MAKFCQKLQSVKLMLKFKGRVQIYIYENEVKSLSVYPPEVQSGTKVVNFTNYMLHM